MIGKNGKISHKTKTKTDKITCKAKTTKPKNITQVRTNIPIKRENCLSNHDLNLSSKERPITSADICLNGENNVLNSKPIEKKSAVAISLSPTALICSLKPRTYHHSSAFTINISIFYPRLTCLSYNLIMNKHQYTTLLGKAVRKVARLKGGGSALPGLFVEKIDPNFIKRTLSSLKRGVLVISGTNGKTTTTKIIVELLEAEGLKVFTNKTGSNFVRGVASALLGEVNIKGELDADIAVLELDEAHAVKFVDVISPDYCLLLNVMRDQLDRFSEIDKTAELLEKVAEETTSKLIINSEDKRLVNIAKKQFDTPTNYFGFEKKLARLMPTDEELYDNAKEHERDSSIKPIVELMSLEKNKGTIKIKDKEYIIDFKLNGIYNIYNAVAALATVITILKDEANPNRLAKELALVEPAFGRGESILIDGTEIEIVLVKNPSGFRLSLMSYLADDAPTMIIINDNYADGRDMSWLWDIDFASLRAKGVTIVSGIRAYDMALRLSYDDVNVEEIEPNILKALKSFIKKDGNKKRIFTTYTAMLEIRKYFEKKTKIKRAL